MFSERTARRSLERLRRRGLDDLEREMVAAAGSAGLEGMRVLEIGGGVGALQAELLDAGAKEGEVVELVAAWRPFALELARERGLETRSSFSVTDILETPEAVAPADIVVLNRVVCCTPDGVELTAEAARHTARTLILSFPRDVFWARSLLRLLNAGMWLLRRSYRAFLHPRSELLAAAESQGLRPASSAHGRLWEYAALTRS
jgi:magnesium-protoporphyrin O-methyltransferase